MPQFKITWQPREFSLLPAAVAARGEASLRLGRRLLQLSDESLGQLQGVAGKELIIVQGAAELLPWVDGVQYLGIDSGAPSLLLPTNYQPGLPANLVERALAARSQLPGMIAVLPHPLLLASMRDARPIVRATLSGWLEQP